MQPIALHYLAGLLSKAGIMQTADLRVMWLVHHHVMPHHALQNMMSEKAWHRICRMVACLMSCKYHRLNAYQRSLADLRCSSSAMRIATIARQSWSCND